MNTLKTSITLLLFMVLISCNGNNEAKGVKENQSPEIFDAHVHIMSPFLINDWKEKGIPFSRNVEHYSNIDTILENSGAEQIHLIGMGYVFENPEYYQGIDGKNKLIEENDFVVKQAEKYPHQIKPFIAVDPLKEYAVEEMKRCYGLNKECGLKLHFSTSQVYLTEQTHLNKVLNVFSYAAKLDWPILLHFDNWHPKFGKEDLTLLIDSILLKVPASNLTIAHFGTSGGFNTKTKSFVDAFIQLRNRIPKRHRVLLDISAVALDKDSEGVSKLTSEEFKVLKNYIDKIGLDQIVFGTDYPFYNGIDYLSVLKNELGFSDEALKSIMKPLF